MRNESSKNLHKIPRHGKKWDQITVYPEVGGPQRSSANRKSANLRTCIIFFICGPSASVAICGFAICGPNIFGNLRFCGPNFLGDLKLKMLYFSLSKYTGILKNFRFGQNVFFSCRKRHLHKFFKKWCLAVFYLTNLTFRGLRYKSDFFDTLIFQKHPPSEVITKWVMTPSKYWVSDNMTLSDKCSISPYTGGCNAYAYGFTCEEGESFLKKVFVCNARLHGGKNQVQHTAHASLG